MVKVAIEIVILLPLLVLQVFIFPMAASAAASRWADNRREVLLQNAANHLGSTLQQLYFSLNQTEISAGNITLASSLPPTIESNSYMATGVLWIPSDPKSNRVLTLSLLLERVGNTAETLVPMGSNVYWNETSVFRSNSLTASIHVQKFGNSTLLFSFG